MVIPVTEMSKPGLLVEDVQPPATFNILTGWNGTNRLALPGITTENTGSEPFTPSSLNCQDGADYSETNGFAEKSEKLAESAKSR